MNIFVVMYQTSKSKGQELVAQRMVKYFNRSGRRSWLITSIFHDGRKIVNERTIALSEKRYIDFREDPMIELPTIRVDSFKTLWPPRRIMFKDLINILRDIEEEFGGIDLIITHSTLWNGPEDVAKWVMWKKLLTNVTGERWRGVYAHMSHYQPPDPSRYDPIERTYRMAWNTLVFPMIFRSANFVLVTTSVEAEDMIHLGAKPDQIFLFPGGLDDDSAYLIDSITPDVFLSKYNVDKDVKIVAYLGSVEERKNPAAVVKVAKILRRREDVLFVIAGKPGDQWEEVISLIKRYDLKNVLVTGELTEEEKASLIKASYVNIILSKMEALGLTQIEFMYGGVPVITSGVYGQKWLIRDGVDGIHVKGFEDVVGAAKAIEQLLNNPELRNKLGENARERARGFLMSKLVGSFLETVRRVLEVVS